MADGNHQDQLEKQLLTGDDATIDEEDEHSSGLPKWASQASLWSSLIVKIILIAGALFSVWQYLEAKNEQRIARTFDLVTLWESDRLQAAYRQLYADIEIYRQNNQNPLQQLAISEPDLNPEALVGQAIWDQAYENGSGAVPRENILTLQYFLSRAVTCSQENLCDKHLISVFFDDFALDFWQYFSDQLEDGASSPSALQIYIETLTKPQANN